MVRASSCWERMGSSTPGSPGSTTAGPNPTTRMIVLGKIFLYQNQSWMPTRDPFLLPYIEKENLRKRDSLRIGMLTIDSLLGSDTEMKD